MSSFPSVTTSWARLQNDAGLGNPPYGLSSAELTDSVIEYFTRFFWDTPALALENIEPEEFFKFLED